MRTLLTTLHSKFIHGSLALPCLAAYCGADCGELLIREFTTHEPRESLLAQILATAPDAVGFSVYLWNREATLALVDALLAVRPELRLFVGGPEVSFEGAALFAAHPGLSALVRGEGEIPARGLLRAWARGEAPGEVPRLLYRDGEQILEGPDGPVLENLDLLPSPFARGLVDLDRALVYYESSRGCPYSCSFCMSALDQRVRSYSMGRIEADLGLLLARRVPLIKFVDRTFNYDPQRTRAILEFLLRHNRGSQIHLEIGAHLLDDATTALLASAPPGMFQLEIGVQTTLPETLQTIRRTTSLPRLEERVRQLQRGGNLHLHLDLIAGLPGENLEAVLDSIDRMLALTPDALQIEPVKLLPGAPLRAEAAARGLRFDPTPPYMVLSTPQLSFADLDRVLRLSRLLDLSWNKGRLRRFLGTLATVTGSPARALLTAADALADLLRHPIAPASLHLHLWRYLQQLFAEPQRRQLTEALAWDVALSERVLPDRVPPFFDTALSATEEQQCQALVRQARQALVGQPVRLQYFAALFHHLDVIPRRQPVVFLYQTRSHQGLTVVPLSLLAKD